MHYNWLSSSEFLLMLGLREDQVCNFPENALLLERLRNHWLTHAHRERDGGRRRRRRRGDLRRTVNLLIEKRRRAEREEEREGGGQ
jgi:hypothetical protein